LTRKNAEIGLPAPSDGAEGGPTPDLVAALGILELEAKVAADRIRALSEERLALREALERQERLFRDASKRYRRRLIFVSAPYVLLLAPISLPVLLVLYLAKRKRRLARRRIAPFAAGRDGEEP
jgi:hypothetical protein